MKNSTIDNYPYDYFKHDLVPTKIKGVIVTWISTDRVFNHPKVYEVIKMY